MTDLATSDNLVGKFLKKMLATEQQAEVAATYSYLVVTGKGTDLANYLETGREFMHFWVEAWQAGLIVQPTQVFVEAEVANNGLTALLGVPDSETVMLAARVGKKSPKMKVPACPPKTVFPLPIYQSTKDCF